MKSNSCNPSETTYANSFKEKLKKSSYAKANNLSITSRMSAISRLSSSKNNTLLMLCKIRFNHRNEIVPKYRKFNFTITNFLNQKELIVYSEPN